MSKEQNEVLEQQRYLLERRMYRLDPAPPKLPLQECIELYFDENEDKYLSWYLHDREPMLNKLAQDACQRYGLGTLNERRVDFYRQYDEGGEETGEDVTVDTTSQPDKLYFQAVLYDALHRAYDNLTYREQRTVAKHLGFCGICWSVKKAVLINGEIEYRPIKPMTFEEISHSASRRSDKASERTYKNALEKMRKALCVK